MGDTIYSDTEVPGYSLDDVALTVAAEVGGLQDEPGDEAVGEGARLGRLLRALGRPRVHQRLRPGRGHLPARRRHRQHRRRDSSTSAGSARSPTTTRSPTARRTGIYRSVRWGKNLEIFFLDERSFRSTAADYHGRLRQPARQRQPATSRRPRRRAPATPSRAIAPPLANPVAPGLPGLDQRPEPDDARLEAAEAKFKQRDRELERDLQGDLQRGPDPAVLRRSLRPLGGL